MGTLVRNTCLKHLSETFVVNSNNYVDPNPFGGYFRSTDERT